jgi:hypothetical protein
MRPIRLLARPHPSEPPRGPRVVVLAARGLLGACALLASTPCFAADPTPAQLAQAEDLFQRAKTAMERREYRAACPMLAESYRLAPAGGTLQNLAVCYEAEGKVAFAFARFNGRLNALAVEWLQGDLTAPVAGRRFDAVVSQPPYVARPPDAATVTFLHAGERGDELALRVVQALPSLLRPGGQAWLLFDSPAPGLAALARSVADAIEPAPMALCLISVAGNEAATQSIAYASVADRSLGHDYAAQVVRYREHFDRLGVTRVRHVLVYAQLRTRAGSLVAIDAADLDGFDGEALVTLLQAADVASLSDAALRDRTVRPHPRARLLHEQSLGPTGVDTLHVRFEQGAGADRGLDDAEALMLLALRDTAPVHAASAAWAQDRELSATAAERAFLAFVRQGLRSGLLVPEPG